MTLSPPTGRKDSQATSRRLTAILAADAVGYSRLMAADEQATMAALDRARDTFRELVAVHHGRIVDTAGDSVLAVFGTALGAMEAALAIQRQIDKSCRPVPEPSRLRFRVGVHLGDVITKPDGSVYGDGVNIAARLQALAPPGGVTASEAVRGAVRGNIAAEFADLGEQQVKNIPGTVKVFSVRRNDARLTAKADPGGPAGASAADAFSVSRPVPGFGGRPAIAVLPFSNLSSDPDQSYFADGVAEDIITRLSMWRWMPVIARNSSFRYRGNSVDPKQVGADLGARYIVAGSVRKGGNRLRVTGELIDADTGRQVWTARHDRVLDEIFELQDEICDTIMAAVAPALDAAERSRAARQRPQDLASWDVYQRACWQHAQMNHDAFVECRRLCTVAAGLDAEFGAPLALAALVEFVGAIFGWWSPAVAIPACHRLACEALRREPLDNFVLSCHAMASAQVGQVEAALESACKAVELNPSAIHGYSALGHAHALGGQLEESLTAYRTALRLSPNDAMAPVLCGGVAAVHYLRREYEHACEIATLGIQRAPDFPMCHGVLARSLAQLGSHEQARAELARFLELSPGYTAESLRRAVPFRDPARLDHWIEGFRILGWQG